MQGFDIAWFLLLEAFSLIRLSIDERGATIHFGHIGLMTQRIPLDRIASAAAFDLPPTAYRVWRSGGGSLARRGSALPAKRGLCLDLVDGKRRCIPIADAETAAGLINGFAQRRGTSAPIAG
jgi:hypothetical protein